MTSKWSSEFGPRRRRGPAGPGLPGFAGADEPAPTPATTIWKLVPAILEPEVPAGSMEVVALLP